MKLIDLAETIATSDLPEMGIDLTKFGERNLVAHENLEEIYQRVAINDPNVLLFDIKEQSFILGVLIPSFRGALKNKALQIKRTWTDEESRGQGLNSTIMYGLYNQLKYALICDDTMSPSGKRGWCGVVKTIHPNHIYSYHLGKKEQKEIDFKEMIHILDNVSDPELIVIVEKNNDPLTGMLEGCDHLFNVPGNIFKKYSFSGFD